MTTFDSVLVTLAVGGAIAVTLFRRRLAAVAGLGVVGIAVALTFVIFGAPDVAMTQFAIETLTVLIFVLVFYHLPQFRLYTALPRRVIDWALSLTFGFFMAVLVVLAVSTDMAPPVSEYFSEAAVPDAKGRNIVNVIIVDFRATDTFGELVVLAIAAIGVATLLHLRRTKRHVPDLLAAPEQTP
jgi:multicomponent Na+:H+ antiporter subunit A